jgi:transcription antitermination factor NusG
MTLPPHPLCRYSVTSHHPCGDSPRITLATGTRRMIPTLAKTEPPPVLSPRAQTVAGMPGRWEIIQCFNNHEAKIAWRLLEAGIGYCLPMERVRKFKGERRVEVTRILWPGYVFVCAEDLSQLRWDFDRRREQSSIRFIPVPDQQRLIHDLTAFDHAMKFDGDRFIKGPIRDGVHCRVDEGSYAGFEGVIDRITGKGYAVLQIAALGQFGSVEVPVEFLSVRCEAAA